MNLPTMLILLVILLFLSGFFSASETALMSLGRADLQRMSTGSSSERTVYALLQKPQNLLCTILVGNMFVNVVLATTCANIIETTFSSAGSDGPIEYLIKTLFPDISNARLMYLNGIFQSILNIAIVTPLLMIFGEQTPKVIAYSKGAALSRFSAKPLAILCRILTPFNWILRTLGNIILMLLGQPRVDAWQVMTSDELLASISVGQASGATDDNEQNILARIVELGDITVKEVMTHRMDVIGIRDSLTLREAFEFGRTRHHSWYPVYNNTLDDAWGLISIVDYPKWLGKKELDMQLAAFRVFMFNDAVTTPVFAPKFVPESAHIDKLLHTMRQEAVSIVIVVDEHGGTSGVASLNDIIEEMLGRFDDTEFDEDAMTLRHDGVVVADGRAHLRAIQKAYGDAFENEDGDADTLGGLIMEKLGHVPRNGETATLEDGTLLRVKRIMARRIRTVEIILPQKSAEEQVQEAKHD